MRKNFGAKPILYPQSVFIIAAYDENGKPNAMNAAWGGVADANKIFICISNHKTTENILARKAFTVSMGTSWLHAITSVSFPAKTNRTKWKKPDSIR